MKKLYCGISLCSCVDDDGYCLTWGFEEDVEDCKEKTMQENLENEVPGIKLHEDYSDISAMYN